MDAVGKGRGRRLHRSCLGEAQVIVEFGSPADHGFSGLQLEEAMVVTSASCIPSVGIASNSTVPGCAWAVSCFFCELIG